MTTLPRLAPDTLEFLLLSFEGPDQYSMAGGLGVRMKELAFALAHQGFRTHLVFVGDPALPPLESPADNLTLHRWSQWLSAYYPAGVYHGEEAKVADWNEQLPTFVAGEIVRPAVAAGRLVAIMAEEWHTAHAACRISDHLWAEGLRDKAIILWNANNIMGFDRIDWRRLDFCTQITTVSRYMKHVMWDWGVNPLVIPNGIPRERIRTADTELVARLRAVFPGRELLFKIGRFSPDKRWNMAIEAFAQEKQRGHKIAAIIRGGVEPHGMEVLANARARGLTITELELPVDPAQAIAALAAAPPADVYQVTSFMSDEVISLFYSGTDAVLANSGHEPFGLVGLEVMAAGGVAFVGSTGEDYAVPYLNSVVLDTDDPTEICIALEFLRTHPEVVARLRADAQETARSFTWENVILDTLLGKLAYVAIRQGVSWPIPEPIGEPAEPPLADAPDESKPPAHPPEESAPDETPPPRRPRRRSSSAHKPASRVGTEKTSAANPRPAPHTGASPALGDASPASSDTSLPYSGASLAYGGNSVGRRIVIRPWPGRARHES